MIATALPVKTVARVRMESPVIYARVETGLKEKIVSLIHVSGVAASPARTVATARTNGYIECAVVCQVMRELFVMLTEMNATAIPVKTVEPVQMESMAMCVFVN